MSSYWGLAWLPACDLAVGPRRKRMDQLINGITGQVATEINLEILGELDAVGDAAKREAIRVLYDALAKYEEALAGEYPGDCNVGQPERLDYRLLFAGGHEPGENDINGVYYALLALGLVPEIHQQLIIWSRQDNKHGQEEDEGGA